MTFGDESQSERQKLNRLEGDLINRWGVETRGQTVVDSGGERRGGGGGSRVGWITLQTLIKFCPMKCFCIESWTVIGENRERKEDVNRDKWTYTGRYTGR